MKNKRKCMHSKLAMKITVIFELSSIHHINTVDIMFLNNVDVPVVILFWTHNNYTKQLHKRVATGQSVITLSATDKWSAVWSIFKDILTLDTSIIIFYLKH